MRVTKEESVAIEQRLEDLAIILERVDFGSRRHEDIEAIAFWPHLRTAMEFLEVLGYALENDVGFDCHELHVVRWRIPEGLVGYLVWLLRDGQAGGQRFRSAPGFLALDHQA